MQLFNSKQIHEWDAYAIVHEPIRSIDLMERAAKACEKRLLVLCGRNSCFYVFCGKGNNGGDGLAIARLLLGKDYQVKVFELFSEKNGSADFETNKQRLQEWGCTVKLLKDVSDFPDIPKNVVIVDTLFGSGLNKPLAGLAEELVQYLNRFSNKKVAVDVPSGMFLDGSSKGNTVFRADETLTFQRLKFCFLLPENAAWFGKVSVLDIGLSDQYQPAEESIYSLVDVSFVQKIYKPRNPYAHKGTFGHALLVAGNQGKMGAAVMAAVACLRSGVGLLTCNIPASESMLLPIAVPEAMSEYRGNVTDFSKYKAIGIGPGLGTQETQLVKSILDNAYVPLVLDADALNMLSQHPDWLSLVPAGSILSPHPKEFERLFGTSANDAERIAKAIEMSVQYAFTVVLKGHNSLVAHEGRGYFNTTGNAGMATGGSGDTLTGILTGLLAQGYSGRDAAVLGVYLHGLAGDLALEKESEESLLPSDLSGYLGKAFNRLREGYFN
ncbi:MAG: NAD(P)H-hydrate dehydratase [Chitinophagaceae bacterium]